MKPQTRMDYVIHYAQLLREDAKYYNDHKRLINAQLQGHRSFFSHHLQGKEFKAEARKYLAARGQR